MTSEPINTSSQPQDPTEIVLPPSLVWLRRLVTTLTVVMIFGFLLLVGMLFVKMRDAPVALDLPSEFVLPDGTAPQSISISEQWVLVLTQDDRLLVFGREGGKIQREINLTSP